MNEKVSLGNKILVLVSMGLGLDVGINAEGVDSTKVF